METSKEIAALHDRLQDYMNSNGLRSTAQRRAVADIFFNTDGHLSIEDLLQLVRVQEPRVGYATVYRTLKLMTEAGIAYERRFGDGMSRYEVAHEDEHHDHLICTECGLIVEFENEEIERLQESLAEVEGFILTRHVHELYGKCVDAKSCKRRRK